jgi:hypothetical protein
VNFDKAIEQMDIYQQRLFALDCADKAIEIANGIEPSVANAIEVARQYINGEITDSDLDRAVFICKEIIAGSSHKLRNSATKIVIVAIESIRAGMGDGTRDAVVVTSGSLEQLIKIWREEQINAYLTNKPKYKICNVFIQCSNSEITFGRDMGRLVCHSIRVNPNRIPPLIAMLKRLRFTIKPDPFNKDILYCCAEQEG